MPDPTNEQDFWNQTVALLEKMAADLDALVERLQNAGEFQRDPRWERPKRGR